MVIAKHWNGYFPGSEIITSMPLPLVVIHQHVLLIPPMQIYSLHLTHVHVLVSVRRVPSLAIGVRGSFCNLMSDDADHAVDSGVTVD